MILLIENMVDRAVKEYHRKNKTEISSLGKINNYNK